MQSTFMFLIIKGTHTKCFVFTSGKGLDSPPDSNHYAINILARKSPGASKLGPKANLVSSGVVL